MLTRQTEKEQGRKLTEFFSPMRRWDLGRRTDSAAGRRPGSDGGALSSVLGSSLQADKQTVHPQVRSWRGHWPWASGGSLKFHILRGKEGPQWKSSLSLTPWKNTLYSSKSSKNPVPFWFQLKIEKWKPHIAECVEGATGIWRFMGDSGVQWQERPSGPLKPVLRTGYGEQAEAGWVCISWFSKYVIYNTQQMFFEF